MNELNVCALEYVARLLGLSTRPFGDAPYWTVARATQFMAALGAPTITVDMPACPDGIVWHIQAVRPQAFRLLVWAPHSIWCGYAVLAARLLESPPDELSSLASALQLSGMVDVKLDAARRPVSTELQHG